MVKSSWQFFEFDVLGYISNFQTDEHISVILKIKFSGQNLSSEELFSKIPACFN